MEALNQPMTRADIERQLKNPRREARDRTRWWWFGCAVDRREICRELDLMDQAGIGGVELQILYPLRADSAQEGVHNQPYLSPGFFQSVKTACDEAHRRGMQFDLTLGSSWPFGGPFVSEEMAAPNVIPYTIDVEGPCRFSYDFTTRIYGECVGCILGKMSGSRMLPETIRDLTDLVKAKYLFGWEWGKELRDIEIPEGVYKIVIFTVNGKKQMVLKPLPGGEGMVIDHDRKDALRVFLENAGDPIVEYLGSSRIDHFFCDSIEVFGQNWTGILYDEFRRRRGYELRPYLYALWGEIQGMTDLIRYDFQKTLAELTVENFFQELTNWAHEKHSLSRVQAHGTWGDILKAYGSADIPEGETFSAMDKYEVNLVHRKLASSAAHIYGKKVISNESYTWLRFPRYVVTLEDIKAATDAIFLDGMNQIVNHGYAYSPQKYGKPGWSFYASTQINHTNTWWPYFRHISLYINRVCDFLQRGKTKVKLAVYLPQHDIWAENPLSDLHMSMKLEERLTTAAADAISKAGFWFDFINDEAAEHLEESEYEALVFLECDRIPVQTARMCRRFARIGHPVICRGRTPSRACGLVGNAERTKEICSLFSEMTAAGQCVVTDDTVEALITCLRHVLTPDVQLERHPEQIGYVHQVDGEQDLYFVSNVSADSHLETIRFAGQTKPFAVFDPLTVREKELVRVETKNGAMEVTLAFEPFQSLLFVFSPQMDAAHCMEPAGRREVCLLTLDRNWKLSVEEKRVTRVTDEPMGWESLAPLRYYSGTGRYSKDFCLDPPQWEVVQKCRSVYVRFEHIGEVATVRINGIEAGDLIKRPYFLEVGPLLQAGMNTIEVQVANLLINCAIDPDFPEPHYEQAVIDEWPYSTAKLNRELAERAQNWREKSMVKSPRPSGIWGKVQLIGVLNEI